DTLVKYTYGVDLVAQERAGETSFFHTDGLGSTRALTDANGAVTDRYSYQAYGDLLAQSGGTANSHLYRGAHNDPQAVAYYLRARYYDPGQGRFISTDPNQGQADQPASLHRYLYADDDPLNKRDPSGLSILLQEELARAEQAKLRQQEAPMARGLLRFAKQR